MRRISLFLAAAALVIVATPAQANPTIMKEAQKTNPAIKGCTACHEKMPANKANLNAEGKKHLKK